MPQRPADSSEDSSRHSSHPRAAAEERAQENREREPHKAARDPRAHRGPAATGVPGAGTAAANRAGEPPGGASGNEDPETGVWREAGPAAGLVARRWVLEVLRVLDQRGPTGFNALRRETGAAGQPLKATLQALARAGLVSRHVISTTAPRSVIYRLTPAARDLFPVLSSLAKWHRTNQASGADPRD
jgi:DNA-binding HxlR family transcriptional regulator